MYKEINRRKNNFVFIILFFLGFAILSYFVTNFLPIVQLVKDIILMAALVSFVFVLIKRFLAEYEYELTDEQIIFKMCLGGRVRTVITADICDMILFCGADDDRLKDFKVSSKKMCTVLKMQYAALFKDNGSFVKVVFAPSKKMVSLIEQKIKTLCGEE